MYLLLLSYVILINNLLSFQELVIVLYKDKSQSFAIPVYVNVGFSVQLVMSATFPPKKFGLMFEIAIFVNLDSLTYHLQPFNKVKWSLKFISFFNAFCDYKTNSVQLFKLCPQHKFQDGG